MKQENYLKKWEKQNRFFKLFMMAAETLALVD